MLEITDFTLQHRTTKGVFLQHPEIIAIIDQVKQDLPSEPFYWKLPQQFEGRKVKKSSVLNITLFFLMQSYHSAFYNLWLFVD